MIVKELIAGEIWKPFPKWEGLYEVSNMGRVKMLERFVLRKDGKSQTFKEKIKKLTISCTTGYVMVTLTEKSTQRHSTYTVHRVVGIVFIPNPLNLPEVNHLWGDKTKITVNDLEWSTKSDNLKHAYLIGLKKPKIGSDAVTARKVGKYLNGRLIKEYSFMGEAEKDGFSRDGIRQAIINEWQHGGYNWKYIGKSKCRDRVMKTKKRKVAAYKGDKLHKIYENVDFVIKEGHDKSNIYKALKNHNSTSGGFVWKYIDESIKKTA